MRGVQCILSHVERCTRLIELCTRRGAALNKSLDAVEIRLRLCKLGFQAGDLRIERLHLQHQFLVADGGDDLAAFDVVTLFHGELEPRCRRCAPAPARH